ncbi:hypothetical protein AWC11_03545 [Mycobacterium interjectum]|nr:hypothetical protein AWC11_03545 [Mycobacterium interjectum]
MVPFTWQPTTELGDRSTDLYQRIESLQPYTSSADIPSLPPLLALLSDAQQESIHALLLLQDYSNEDKHRSVRLAVPRTIVQRSDVPFYETDRRMRPIEVGDILASVREGEPIMLESTTALIVERPGTSTWVSPTAELARLHAYVAHVAIPTLVTGTAPTDPPLPDVVDLSDNGQTLAERIKGGGHLNAHERMRIEADRLLAEHANRPPTLLRTED